MWVAPSARRNGIGKGLMDAVFVWAEQEQLDEMILFVAQGNNGLRNFTCEPVFVETGTLRPLHSNKTQSRAVLAVSILCFGKFPGHPSYLQ
jgi:L-amino acid N-acyltransferase YncA